MSSEDIRNILANKVRVLRNSRGWTQERLAEEIDIHSTYVSRIESGKKLPTVIIICKIAEALGVSAHELLMEEVAVSSLDYKKQRLINILKESKPTSIDIYSTLLDALHKKYSKKKRKQEF